MTEPENDDKPDGFIEMNFKAGRGDAELIKAIWPTLRMEVRARAATQKVLKEEFRRIRIGRLVIIWRRR